MESNIIKERLSQGRSMEHLDGGKSSYVKHPDDKSLSLIETMQGTWSSAENGWNLIALPFKDSSAPFNYRVLMNQYGEDLSFKFADRNIPNRGITEDSAGITDQLLDALDYQQVIKQVAAEDSPSSTLVAPDGNGIHHEPGLVLQILNHESTEGDKKLNIARLATIPHGDSVLALGTVEVINGAPQIPVENALPIRVGQDVDNNPYLAPYKHFEDNHFFGTVPPTVPGFPGFFATNANAILQFALGQFEVVKTTILHFDTKFGTGGIINIPFVVQEANATEMTATFWIMELTSGDLVMQYSQTVFLDFFDSRDEPGKLIRWPHVSINTLTRSA